MNAPIQTDAAVSAELAEDLLVAIEEATDCIIQMHMDLPPEGRDGDEAMNVLHRLLVAKVQIQGATSGQVQP